MGPKTRFLLLSDSCGFVDVARTLWREDRSVVHNCCWPHQRSHSQVRVPKIRGSPQPGGPGSCIYIAQEQESLTIIPGTGFPFRRLLRLAGLRWRYSNPPPHGLSLKPQFLLYNIQKFSSYLTRNALRLCHKDQPVNAVWRNSRCLLWEPYETHKYTVWAERRVLVC
jgi:hypothetical protein